MSPNSEQPGPTSPGTVDNRSSELETTNTEHANVQQEYRIGPFKITPTSKVARRVIGPLSVLLALFAIWKYFAESKQFVLDRWPTEPVPSIAIFLPDPSRSSECAFYQDGSVQKRGFDKALQDAEILPKKLVANFHYMNRDDGPEVILDKMKVQYASAGATFFVMTMSGKVDALRNHFGEWHNDCKRQGKRAPVLVATVASAPGLANLSDGILRWYVRSEEESTLLAEYLRWKESVAAAVVFYITRNARQSDDRYGTGGMEIFKQRFESLGGMPVETYSVTAGTAKGTVKHYLDQKRNLPSPPATGAYLVGYGDMLSETIRELIEQGFAGPIACASTLTDPDWQPKDTSADNRIVTVMPRIAKSQSPLQGDDQNVVFFFAKQTLSRVLNLTALDADPAGFISSWSHSNEKSGLEQFSLADGDTIVQLDVVGASKWR